MPRPKKKDFDKMAKVYVANKCKKIGVAMIAGGYAKSSSQRGKASMTHTDRDKFDNAVERHMKRTLGEYAELGEKITAEQQEKLVRGALIANVASGEDKAVGSLRLLGNDKRVNMFTPESASGVIVIQAVPIPSFDNIPKLTTDAESDASRSYGDPIGKRLTGGGCGWDSNFKHDPPPE